jgi:hypothetical protein
LSLKGTKVQDATQWHREVEHLRCSPLMIPPLICKKLHLKDCDAKIKLSFIKNISKQGGVQGERSSPYSVPLIKSFDIIYISYQMSFIQLQFRRGNASQWTIANPILADGELAIESDTSKFKIGNGIAFWNQLPYGGLVGPTGAIGSNVPNDISFNGNIFVGRDVSFGGKLTVRNDVSFNTELRVGGNVNIRSGAVSTSIGTGALIVAGGAGVGGNVWTGGNLNVALDTSLTSRLLVGGNVLLSSNLTVGADAYFNGNTSVAFLPFYGGNPSVTPALNQLVTKKYVDENGGTILLGANNTWTANNTFNGSRFYVGGDASFNSNLTVREDVSFNKRLFVGGDASFNGNLIVRGDVSFNDNMSVQSDSSFNNRLYVGKQIGVGVTANAAYALDVFGNIHMSGNLFLNNKLFSITSADISLNANLMVGADASFNGNVFVAKTLNLRKTVITGAASGSPTSIVATTPIVEITGSSASTAYFTLTNGSYAGQTLTINSAANGGGGGLFVNATTTNIIFNGSSCSQMRFSNAFQTVNLLWSSDVNQWIVASWQGVNFSGVSMNFGTYTLGDISFGAAGRVNITAGGNLVVGSDSSFNGNLSVGVGKWIGIGKMAGANYALDVGGNINLTGNLYTNGVLFSAFDNSKDISLNANLTVGFDSSFNANLYVGRRFTVAGGDVSLNQRLTVGGADSSFNGNLYVGGFLNVNGYVNADSYTEKFVNVASSSGTYTADFAGGLILYVNAFSGTSTPTLSITNLPTLLNQSYVFTVVYSGAPTSTYFSSLNINGVSVPVNGTVSLSAATSYYVHQFCIFFTDATAISNNFVVQNFNSSAPASLVSPLISGNLAVSGNINLTGGNIYQNGVLFVGGGGGGSSTTGTTLSLSDTTASTSSITGALTVAGGAGVGGNVQIGGNVKIASAVASTSSLTGALIVGGGAGIAGNVYVGGNLYVTGTTALTGIPSAPTAAAGTDTTQIATTQYVRSEIASKAPINNPTFTGTVGGITKTTVGLGLVDNTSDASKPVSTLQQTALNLKANLASPTFTGTPSAPTAAGGGTGSTQIATTEYVRGEISALVGGAGTALDTLNELATALGTDAAFSTTVTTAIGLRANIANPTFTGIVSTPALSVTGTTASTSSITGALVVGGGAGIAGNVSVGGNVNFVGDLYKNGTLVAIGGGSATTGTTLSLSDTTQSTSSTTGALTVAGGAGIGGNVNVDGDSVIVGSLFVGQSSSMLTYIYNFENNLLNTGTISGLNGIDNGTVTYSTDFKVGTKSLSLNGTSQFVTIPGFQFSSAGFSIAFWVKINDTTNPTERTFINFVNNTTLGSNTRFYITSGNNMFIQVKNSNIAGILGTFGNNQWAHIAFTVTYTTGSSGTIKTYKNGVLDQSQPTVYPVTTDFHTIYIGRDSATGIQYTTMLIDNLIINNSVWSDADVTNVYSNISLSKNFKNITNISNTGVLSVNNYTTSVSGTTGALTVAGGVGIGGSLFVGGVTSSLSGYNYIYSFENNLFNSGSSGSTYNGTDVGTPSYSTGISVVGTQALSLNGTTQYVTIPNFQFSSDGFSIAFWVKMTFVSSAVNFINFVNNTSSGNNTFINLENLNDLYLNIKTSGVSTRTGLINNSIGSNIWRHVVLTASYTTGTGGTITTYANGVRFQGIGSMRYPDVNHNHTIYIGRDGLTGAFSTMSIDNLIINNGVWTNAQVTAIYNNEITPNSSFNVSNTGVLNVTNPTASTSSTTGALIVGGGVGIGGAVNVGGGVGIGGVVNIGNTTVSTSTATGALVVGGGVGIGEDLYVNNNIEMPTASSILRFVNTNNNKKIVLYDFASTEDPAGATQFFGFGINGDGLRYQVQTGFTHRFYTGSSAGAIDCGAVTADNITLRSNSRISQAITVSLSIDGSNFCKNGSFTLTSTGVWNVSILWQAAWASTGGSTPAAMFITTNSATTYTRATAEATTDFKETATSNAVYTDNTFYHRLNTTLTITSSNRTWNIYIGKFNGSTVSSGSLYLTATRVG